MSSESDASSDSPGTAEDLVSLEVPSPLVSNSQEELEVSKMENGSYTGYRLNCHKKKRNIRELQTNNL